MGRTFHRSMSKNSSNLQQLQAYGSLLQNAQDLAQGKRVHHCILIHGFHGNRYLSNLLVELYGHFCALQDACSIFCRTQSRNLFSWNIMIAAFVQHGFATVALKHFRQMLQEGFVPDRFTFSTILGACTSLPTSTEGKIIHAMLLPDRQTESSAVVGTALIKMYSKHGSIVKAQQVFENVHPHDTVSQSAMISAYSQHDHGDKAVQIFHLMKREGLKPDTITFIGVLAACASLATLAWGRIYHFRALQNGFDADNRVGNAIINMYGKCGMLEDAQWVFDRMHQQDVVSWTALISGHAQLGQVQNALQLFFLMQLNGVKPNEVTFVSILSACSHVGLINEGLLYFISMNEDHQITPTLEHYGCMIDLYGRAGWLEEAEEFITKMSSQPSTVTWQILLGACRIHSDVDRGKRAAQKVMQLDPCNVASYVALADFYATE